MSNVPSAFFVRTATGAATFKPTALTIGPWDARLQHAGPPSALMAHIISQRAQQLNTPLISKMHVMVFRPIPLVELSVATQDIRTGKKVSHLSAVLTDVASGKEYARAIATCVRRAELVN